MENEHSVRAFPVVFSSYNNTSNKGFADMVQCCNRPPAKHVRCHGKSFAERIRFKCPCRAVRLLKAFLQRTVKSRFALPHARRANESKTAADSTTRSHESASKAEMCCYGPQNFNNGNFDRNRLIPESRTHGLPAVKVN